ncbi:TPA: hypothetical protein N0F65_003198 [Lagenidium giganteum]|uniref:Uncharacterized protein n=1 Tax=Lagenidium giganteum TaxID=4803 RepID=A0AAV2ZAU3_9STRA|nr:TPA: hypothetical protein N0F65_003198 [Lagenidium giganteum]
MRATTELEVFDADVATVEQSTRVHVQGKDLHLSLLLREEELAPLFSGAAWAGTLLWDAAVYLARHFLVKYKTQLDDPANTLRVIELGAGIGVPGMAARVGGANHVIITEQDDLLELMHRNLSSNMEVLRLTEVDENASSDAIVARPLSWGVKETNEYLAAHPNEPIDVILSCDCIYEPLYGQSWRALAQTMEMLCQQNPKALVIMGVERRNQDGIDKFLAFVDAETRLSWKLMVETVGTKDNRIELYYLTLA